MVDELQTVQQRIVELDGLRGETERIIAESKKLLAQMEERLEELRQLRLAHDALLAQRREQQKKT